MAILKPASAASNNNDKNSPVVTLKGPRRFTMKAGLSSVGVLLLTSIHHAYGAAIYGTPWRLHVIHIAAWVIAGQVVMLAAFYRRSRTLAGQTALWLFIIFVVLFPIGWIGLFEGGYGHLLKNSLYFMSAPPALMAALFPPPFYELPNDVFFEVTEVCSSSQPLLPVTTPLLS